MIVPVSTGLASSLVSGFQTMTQRFSVHSRIQSADKSPLNGLSALRFYHLPNLLRRQFSRESDISLSCRRSAKMQSMLASLYLKKKA